MCYKRGVPRAEVVRYKEVGNTLTKLGVSFKLLSSRNIHLDHLHLRATVPYRHVSA